ncbi:hypothetical protein [Amycolatopsis sp. DSM 110486]|uniref:hypothetical protein n=1 Tax=Amycolatopsis sp. DSM 110486 TaxID=2865832 RepID=UPI001C697329|nr:hypothetical protein [Amycolatopsis sp. DSM 110486]QYN21250.1 hypothetical protein K1T34_01345 [Amycolatopsis sp. DSM 110486]
MESTERRFDPDDPEYFIAQLARDREAAPAEAASPRVESDDAGIPADGGLSLDESRANPGPTRP